MKCTRCFRMSEAIMCSTCYSQNCKHNEEGRRALTLKYQEVVNVFESILQQHLHYGTTLSIINRNAAIMHSHKNVEELLQSKHDLLLRKRKQNQFLKQKIADRKAYIKRLQLQTNQVHEKIKQKQSQKYILSQKAQKNSMEIKQSLQSHFKDLIRFVKLDAFNSSKQTWSKFLNMQQQYLGLYVALMENEMENEIVSEISKVHEQIKKQMIVVGILSSLLEIALPYQVELQSLLKRKAFHVIFMETSEGTTLNKQLLREFQVNVNYLFSRFGIEMEYPQISCQALSSLLTAFLEKKLRIIGEDNFDYTLPIYISSLQMVEAIFSRPVTLSDSIGITMEDTLFELTAESLLSHHKDRRERSKITLEEQTTKQIEFTEIIELSEFQSLSSSDDQVQILQ